MTAPEKQVHFPYFDDAIEGIRKEAEAKTSLPIGLLRTLEVDPIEVLRMIATIDHLKALLVDAQGENERLRKLTEWQPIESAPKQGLFVGLYWDKHYDFKKNQKYIPRRCLARWCTAEEQEYWDVPYDDFEIIEGFKERSHSENYDEFYTDRNFTHWAPLIAPLPQPPTVTGSEGE